MVNEGTGNGFFSRLKGVFSSADNTATHDDNANETTTATLTEEQATNEDVAADNVTETDNRTNRYETVAGKEIPIRTVEVTAPKPAAFIPSEEQDLDIRFATKFIHGGGKFVFCESIKEAIENLRMLKEEQGWSYVFCWENEMKDAFCDNGFQKGAIGYTLENSQAAVSLCEGLAADEGTIILNPKQASRRTLSTFPKTHIIITDVAHLNAAEADALDRFKQMNKGELPSVIKLGSCNTGHFYDKQRLILNANGTEDVYVFLVDELIPVSLRP